MKHMKMAILTMIFIAIAIMPVFALDNTVATCMPNNILLTNVTDEVTIDGNTSLISNARNTYCPYGCNNVTKLCIGETQKADIGTPIAVVLFTIGMTSLFFYLMTTVDVDDWALGLLFMTLAIMTSLVGLGTLNQYIQTNMPASAANLFGDLIIGYLFLEILIGGYVFINTIKNVFTGKNKNIFKGQYK